VFLHEMLSRNFRRLGGVRIDANMLPCRLKTLQTVNHPRKWVAPVVQNTIYAADD
jgi:hypothetical protein